MFRKNPDVLLKKATAKEKSGDIKGAIRLLRKAYKEISKGPISYSVNTFLRLPLYLQKAGQSDKAWKEFKLLLTKGYPNQIKIPELIPMDHSIIYDKMRLFLQREGKNELAVKFGVFSYLSWATGLYRQERYNELNEYTSEKFIREIVLNLLKKARKEELLTEICAIIERQVKLLPNIDFNKTENELNEVIKLTNESSDLR